MFFCFTIAPNSMQPACTTLLDIFTQKSKVFVSLMKVPSAFSQLGSYNVCFWVYLTSQFFSTLNLLKTSILVRLPLFPFLKFTHRRKTALHQHIITGSVSLSWNQPSDQNRAAWPATPAPYNGH